MVITFVQPKGGAGKSTVLVNIAAALLNKGYSIGLLDTDQQNTTARWFERREEKFGVNSKIECVFAQGQITDIIIAMKKRNDFVLIDTAGFNSFSQAPALMNTNLAISPFRPKQYDIETVDWLLNCLETVKYVNPTMKNFSVINQCPTTPNSTRAEGAVQHLEKHGVKSFKTFLYNREVYGDSGEEGMGVSESDNEKAVLEINNLCEEVINACKNI